MAKLLDFEKCRRKDQLQSLSSSTAESLDLNSEYQLPRSIPQLDRLRGLAILLVLLDHIGSFVPSGLSRFFGQGWIGVDLFFVLSGFLITGVLWETQQSPNYFKQFYVRRILRIWPAYLLLLIFAFCILPLLRWTAGGLFLEIPKETLGVWAYLLMIQNFFGTSLILSPFLVITWSLAIEEQFYLVWPGVIRYATRKVILPCLAMAIFLLPLLRILAMHYGIEKFSIHSNPLTHADGLLCGAVIAIWLRSAKPKRRTLLLWGTVLLIVGIGAFVALHPRNDHPGFDSPFLYSSVALLSSGLLLVSLVSTNLGSILHRFFFMNRPLSFLGYISYSLYLYHYFILRSIVRSPVLARIDHWHHRYLTEWILELFGVGLSILLAWLSRVTIERAALSKKRIFD